MADQMSTAPCSAPTHDVCVVGLGPTGLLLAHLLGRRGLSVLVLEREPAFYGLARAVYTDDECLRILQNAGLADELHARMVVGAPVQWRRADGSVLTRFHDPAEPHQWPTSNFLYQPFLENTLEQRLAEVSTVQVLRGRELVAFDQDAEGVTVRHRASTGIWGQVETTGDAEPAADVRVSYLIGADGGRSTVRSHLGEQMTGERFPQRWLVVDLEATRPGVFDHLSAFDFICDPALPTISCPQPEGRHRFEFMLHEGDSTEHFERLDTVRALLAQHVDAEAVRVTRRLVYTFNALMAQRWRHDRVLLAGDAAHMTPQFIGQGMNAGLRDADNLSWKLAEVLLRGATPDLLDTYETERRPHAAAMTRLSVLNKDVVSTQRRAAIVARDVGLRAATRIPGLRTLLSEARVKPRPRFRRDAFAGQVRARGLSGRGVQGTLPPQPLLRTRTGAVVRADDAWGTDWVILGIGVDPREVFDHPAWGRIPALWCSYHSSNTRTARVPGVASSRALVTFEGLEPPRPGSVRQGSFDRWLRRAGARTGHVLVLRPDKYVFSLTAPHRHRGAVDDLLRSLG